VGELPKAKMHCSVMTREALEKAIAHFNGMPVAEAEGTIICGCFEVTEPEIERAVRENDLKTEEEVTNCAKAPQCTGLSATSTRGHTGDAQRSWLRYAPPGSLG
jgi:NAD(P)H-nitrite reductase large subunit